MKKKKQVNLLTRREALVISGKVLALGSCGVLSTSLLGCGENSTTGITGTGNWAEGGTDLISTSYPSDSLFTSTGVCPVAVTTQTTEGPCYFADTTGEDISLGLEGLPMQLCLRLIDANCNPLQGYKIEVWHCDAEGVYSGDTSSSSDSSSFAGDFCTGGDSAAEQSTWFRGVLTTNSSGRVNFKSCFPGWYSGRTIHIHFAIIDSNNNRQLVSQFCFTDKLAEQICTTHSLYSSRGSQDKPLSGGSDTVFPSSGYEVFQLRTQQNDDDTLLAYHTIQLT